MSLTVSSPVNYNKKFSRPATPIRRRSIVSPADDYLTTTRLDNTLDRLISQLQDSRDSSTQLLIRLYNHKSIRLQDDPQRFLHFQHEIYTSLRRLHPSLSIENVVNQEIQNGFQPKAIVTCRSAQATVRKLH